MKLNQFAFIRAFGRGFSSQIEPPTECFFNFMKDIPGYEGRYAVTEDCRVWSYRKKGGNTNGAFMVNLPNRYGYFTVKLTTNTKSKSFLVHRLVAIAYIPNPENKPCINHKNGIRTDNRIENLEWCTYGENIRHAFRCLGRKHKHMKKVLKMDMDGNVLDIYESILEATKYNKVYKSTIRKCFLGKAKHAGGFRWKLASDLSLPEYEETRKMLISLLK